MVIAYDSLGYYEMMNSIMQSLTENPNYILNLVEKSWAMQLDKESEQTRKWQKTIKSNGDCCAKQKANLQLAHVNEGKAQPDGHFYEHGKAFDTSTGDEVVADDTEKNGCKTFRQKST